MPNPAPIKTRLVISILLSISVLAAYWGVVENVFIGFDDPYYVVENHHVRQGLTPETFLWAVTTSHTGNWHPLTWISLMLDRELFGFNPAGYHWTSVILHLMGGLVLFLALSRMTAAGAPSGVVAALFLLHPLHVESVAWVAERKDVLSGLFWMLGLWCYARYAERPSLGRYLWVCFAFAGGLLAKPMVVTFPFVLLLLDWWPLGRLRGGWAGLIGLIREKVPLFLLSAAASVVTFIVQRDRHAMPSLEAMPLADRLANAATSYTAYLGKTFWPEGLSIFYPHHGMPDPRYLFLALSVLLAVTIVAVLVRKRHPFVLMGWLWYLGTLVPVIGIVQVGSQAMADRYTYLPLVGVFVAVVWGVRDLVAGSKGRAALGCVVASAAAFLLVHLTQVQVGYWKDNPTLFGHALEVTKDNFLAHQLLAEGMVKTGDLAGAEQHYREAIRIRPKFKNAQNGLGYILMIRGKHGEAARIFEGLLRDDPEYVPAMKNLGDVRMRQHRIRDALPLYRKAVLLYEEDAELLNNFGVALFFAGEKEEASRRIRAALLLSPDYREAQDNLRKILEADARQKSETGNGPAEGRSR